MDLQSIIQKVFGAGAQYYKKGFSLRLATGLRWSRACLPVETVTCTLGHMKFKNFGRRFQG